MKSMCPATPSMRWAGPAWAKTRVPRWSIAGARPHDAANLFVTDGSQMSSTSCVNPSMTFMAFTARAADHAVKLAKAGTI